MANHSSPSFIELHARSAFSFHAGSSQPEELVRRAAAIGLPALAVTDRDGVYGSARAHHAAKECLQDHGQTIRTFVGAELTLDGEYTLPVLVRNRTGYQNLCQLITAAKARGLDRDSVDRIRDRAYAAPDSDEDHRLPLLHPDFLHPRKSSRIHWTELEEFSDGLIALTGDEDGPIRRALATGDPQLAEDRLQRLTHLFGKNNVAVEIQRHHLRGEEYTVSQLRDLAEAHDLPLLASNGVTFARKHGRLLYDAFTCLRHHTHLDAAGTLLARNGERYLKSPRQMRELFRDLPYAVDNSLRIADRLEFTLENLGYQFPEYPVADGHDQSSYLRQLTDIGARHRYGRITKKIRRQLDHELDLIGRLGFCGYFLIVRQIVDFARDQGILVQGRGSAANSAVCYCLGITAVDAIKQKLLFERFLSEGRESWPDIDLDLPSGDRRESVIQEVFRRYAPRGAAMTANVITYRGRSAMREMGKVLNLPEDTLGRFSEVFGSSHVKNETELRERVAEAGLAADHPRLPALAHLYEKIYGLPRHLGQHSGGMIISNRRLDTVVPLEPASMPGRTVVQWDKDDCEDLGIIKVDLLGLGMLAAMQDTLTLCQKRGRPVDLATVPKDDPATYETICRADTIGMFQIESRAQIATLPRMRPRVFYDLCVEVALIRPGPIVGGMVHPYLDRRNGKQAIDYIDDRFKPALERTLGIPLFQEQVLQMAMIVADFTGSQAEELRRAISFNRSEERMQKVMAKLRAAMERKQVDIDIQNRIAQSIQSFALYGFPESHAISFALIAYASAWLKVHRPVEFYVGLLNNQPMGFYSRATLVNDAKTHHLRVRPVSVVASQVECTVENDTTLRLGLNQVKSLSRASAERIVAEREQNDAGIFQNLDDFLLRAKLSKNERRALARLGALNDLPDAEHRRDAMWKAERHLDAEDLFTYARRNQDEGKLDVNKTELHSVPSADQREIDSPLSLSLSASGQGNENGVELHSTFSPLDHAVPLDDAENEISEISPLAAMTPFERLQSDYDTQGLTTGPHPMAYVRKQLNDLAEAEVAEDSTPAYHYEKIFRASDLASGTADQHVTIAGLVTCRQRPSTAKGHVFVSLEDETGIANAFVPGPTFEKYRLVITQEPFLKIDGRLQIDENGITSVYTEHAEALPFATTVSGQSHDFH